MDTQPQSVHSSSADILGASKGSLEEIQQAAGQAQKHEEKCQLINQYAELVPGFSSFLNRIGISDDEKAYNIVAVIGPQSTGKSTLLNQLFGTKFVTAEIAGPQTTQGIWASRDQENNIIVLDVEGSDSLEQQQRSTIMQQSLMNQSQIDLSSAQSQATLKRNNSKVYAKEFFELSTGLFALRMSNIFLINIMQNQSGQDTGSGFSVLRYILKLNLEIFRKKEKEEKKRIIIVVRDTLKQAEDTTRTRIMENLRKEWELLDKPEEIANTRIEDAFGIEIVCLPHFIYQRDEFDNRVKAFREVFIANARATKKIADTNLPAGDLETLMDGIWQQIKTNEDVDIPAQKDLLAEKQCHKAYKQVAEKQSDSIAALENVTEGQFADSAKQLWESTLEQYKKLSKKYQPHIALNVQIELEKEITSKLTTVLRNHLRQLARQIRNNLDTEFEKHRQQVKEAKTNKLQTFKQLIDRTFKYFEDQKKRLTGAVDATQFANLTSAAAANDEGSPQDTWAVVIKQEIDAAVELDRNLDQFVRSQIDDALQYVKTKILKGQVREDIELIFTNLYQTPDQFWPKVSDAFMKTMRLAHDNFSLVLDAARSRDKEKEYWQKQKIAEYVYTEFEELISRDRISSPKKLIPYLITLLEGITEFKARPKKLGDLDHARIDKIFDEAKAVVLDKVLNDFSAFALNPENQLEVSMGKPILSQQALESIRKELIQKIDEMKEEAKAMKYFGFIKEVPIQMWIILAFFAYDDILRMILSPFWIALGLLVTFAYRYLKKNDQMKVVFQVLRRITSVIEQVRVMVQGAQAVHAATSPGKKNN